MRHVLAVSLLAMLPLTVACQPKECAAPGSVDVVAASATPDSAVDQVRATIDSFARWTDGQGVCVDTVYLTDEMPEHAADGMVNARGAWVTLSDEPDGPTLEQRTVHQLCHAADQALDLSAQGPFANEEAFAVACTEGPKAAEQLAYTVCASGDPAAQALLDDLFVGTWPQRIHEGEWEVDDTVGTVGFDDDGMVVPAAEGAAILDWSIDRSGTVPALRLVEEDRESDPIYGPTVAADTGWQLFGGGGEHPVLLMRDANGSHAVRFDLDAHSALYVPVPRSLAFDEAVVADGALWGAGSVDGQYGAWRVDLTTGKATPWSTPSLVERPLASHGRIAIPHGEDVLVFEVDTGTWHAWSLPLHLTALEAMPDAVGSLSVRWSQAEARGLARMASPMGDVQLDVEACGDSFTSDAQGTWVAGPVDASWTAPDPMRAQLDVVTLTLR